MLIKTGYPNLLHAYVFFVLTWWIINEFEKLLELTTKITQQAKSVQNINNKKNTFIDEYLQDILNVFHSSRLRCGE